MNHLTNNAAKRRADSRALRQDENRKRFMSREFNLDAERDRRDWEDNQSYPWRWSPSGCLERWWEDDVMVNRYDDDYECDPDEGFSDPDVEEEEKEDEP